MHRGLVWYLVKRVFFLIPLLFGVSILSFALVRIGNKSPAALMAGPTASEAEITLIEEQLGLHLSLPEQYWVYIVNAAKGDFGTSWISNRPVMDDILDRLPVTLELMTYGLILAIIIGVATGMVSAIRQNKAADQILRVLTLIGLSFPIFWLGLLFIGLFFSVLGWAPPPLGRIDRFVDLPPHITGFLTIDSIVTGHWDAAWSSMQRLALPVLTLGVISGAEIAKQVRSEAVEVLSDGSVRYARACGLPESQVIWLALRNILPNLVTFFAIVFSLSLGGSALIELVFSWPGLGLLGIDAIVGADFAVVQGYIVIMGILTAATYLLSDVLLAFLDPRVRLR